MGERESEAGPRNMGREGQFFLSVEGTLDSGRGSTRAAWGLTGRRKKPVLAAGSHATAK